MDIATLQQITDHYVKALEAASSGKPSSIEHIANTIPSSPLVGEGETFQAMAIGGTNFKTATIKKTITGLEMLKLTEKAQPPAFGTKEDFFHFIEENLAENITVLAINFAFHIEPVFTGNKLEAVLIQPAKEHAFEGLVGKNLAVEIEQYIKEKAGRALQVSIANDTICLLLSGKTQIKGENLAAGIVGTGLNFAYFENETTPINTESGGFSDFEQTPTGKKIDEASIYPGVHIFEKEVAGAYLYMHFNLLAKEKGYFIPPLETSKQVNDLAAREDGSQAAALAQEILRQSAQLAATAIAGITKYKKQDMHFVMVGSLFWKGDGYKTIVRETVRQLVPEHTVDFLGVENADLLGAAKLVA